MSIDLYPEATAIFNRIMNIAKTLPYGFYPNEWSIKSFIENHPYLIELGTDEEIRGRLIYWLSE